MASSEAAKRANRKYAAKNKEKLKQRNLQYRLAHPELCMLRAAKQRALKKGLEFNLTEHDIRIPKECPILGIQLERAIGKGQILDSSPSLDRIDSTKGYVKENVWVISTKANAMKSSATREELIRFSNWVYSTYK